jgi:hypothetical protein
MASGKAERLLPTVTLTGKTGTDYTLFLYPLEQGFQPAAGFYAVLREEGEDLTVLYVEATAGLDQRIDEHPKRECMRHFGANRIAVRVEPDRRKRLEAWNDLVATFDPPCNR